ncbi:MAG: M67 family metallopeptidase [Endomicrobia bacterium]|nr:M67 family metallopeptidase [Endomicrobiia bacterium]
MIYFTKKQIDKLFSFAKSEYPKECCGILAGKFFDDKIKVEKIYKMENVSETPELCYFMQPQQQLKVLKEIRSLDLEMVGIFHSHTYTEAYPSYRDLELAFYYDVVYIIISLQKIEEPKIRAFKISEKKDITEIEVKIE